MLAQILAIIIFLVMFVLIVMEKIEKQWITLTSGLLTLILVFGVGMRSMSAVIETLNIKPIFTLGFWYGAGESSTGVNWATIIFLFGMMVMVEGMARVGFFRWLCLRIAKAVNYKVIPIFITFMILSGVLAMFIDSITVILFLAAVTIELGQLLKFNPVPMILAEVFCANLGGSATMCGDPPNIIIGTSFGFSFADFLVNTGVIAGISLVITIVYFHFIYKKQLVSEGEVDTSALPDPAEAITDKNGFIVSTVIFLLAVVALITHAQTELSVATIGVAVAILTLVTAPSHAKEVLKGVDFKTLGFFLGLFIVVGGLEQTGVLELIASFIEHTAGSNIYVLMAIILWLSAICSAFIDNIPFAATMVPIVRSIATTSADPTGVLHALSWSLAIGTDIGGSATPIGASANVVGVAKAQAAGYKIGWGKYCKAMAPATIIVVAVSMIYLFVRYAPGLTM